MILNLTKEEKVMLTLIETGFPGIIVAAIAILILKKKCTSEKRKKYLRIGAYVFMIPFVIDIIMFGPTSLLSVAVYGFIGVGGIMMAVLSIIEKQWLSVLFYTAPTFWSISMILLLGP